MKRFQLRLRSLLWLVAIAAAFLGGIRYGEYRVEARRGENKVVDIVLSPSEAEKFEAAESKLFVIKPHTRP